MILYCHGRAIAVSWELGGVLLKNMGCSSYMSLRNNYDSKTDTPLILGATAAIVELKYINMIPANCYNYCYSFNVMTNGVKNVDILYKNTDFTLYKHTSISFLGPYLSNGVAMSRVALYWLVQLNVPLISTFLVAAHCTDMCGFH